MKLFSMKKLAAAALSLTMVMGAVPAVSAYDYQTIKFDEETGTLTLLTGDVDKDEVQDFSYEESVLHVNCEEGAVLPADSSHMFEDFQDTLDFDLKGIDTSNVTSFNSFFEDCYDAEVIDVSDFDTSKATDMYDMFYDCYKVKSLDVSGFDTSNVENMGYMFGWLYELEELDVSNFNTSKVTNMAHMFEGGKYKTLDLSNFDLSNVESFYEFIYENTYLENLILPTATLKNNVDCEEMFEYNPSLKSLDLSSLTFPEEFEYDDMFYGLYSLRLLTINDSLKINSDMELFNNDEPYTGWVKLDDAEHTVVSGNDYYAEFSGADTYLRYKPLDKHEGYDATCEDAGKLTYYTDPHDYSSPSSGNGVPEYDETLYTDENGIEPLTDLNEDGEVNEDDLIIAPLDHDWGEWEVVEDPTTEKEGLKRRVCQRDPEHYQERPLDKLEPEDPTDDPEDPTDDSQTPTDDSQTPSDDSKTPADDSQTPAPADGKEDSAAPADSTKPADENKTEDKTSTDKQTTKADDKQTDSKADDKKTDTAASATTTANPATGAGALSLAAVTLAAGAIVVSRKRK